MAGAHAFNAEILSWWLHPWHSMVPRVLPRGTPELWGTNHLRSLQVGRPPSKNKQNQLSDEDLKEKINEDKEVPGYRAVTGFISVIMFLRLSWQVIEWNTSRMFIGAEMQHPKSSPWGTWALDRTLLKQMVEKKFFCQGIHWQATLPSCCLSPRSLKGARRAPNRSMPQKEMLAWRGEMTSRSKYVPVLWR